MRFSVFAVKRRDVYVIKVPESKQMCLDHKYMYLWSKHICLKNGLNIFSVVRKNVKAVTSLRPRFTDDALLSSFLSHFDNNLVNPWKL